MRDLIKRITAVIPAKAGIHFAILAFLVLFNCHAFAVTKQNITYNENNTTIQVTREHPEFSIKLKSNPTTGYVWSLREYNTEMITLLGHHFIAPEKKLIGAGGYEAWDFRVNPEAFIAPQKLTIQMVYARPWKNTDASTELTFHVITK